MSVYSNILRDVKTALETVLNGIPHDQFYVRKRPEFRKGHDSVPAVFVCPEKELIESTTFANDAVLDYPVVVVLVNESALDLERLTEQLDWRETVRLTLWKTSIGSVTEVFDCSYEPDPAFDTSGLEASFDVSVQRFTFRARQTRATV